MKNKIPGNTQTQTSAPRHATAWLMLLPAMMVLAGQNASAQTNANGSAQTISSTGSIDKKNPFFLPMGNGRACVSCHQENAGWSITPANVQARFNDSQGNDPIFKLVDGANSPKAVVTTLAQKKAAYSMLLNRAVIRVGLPIPANAEFTLIKAEDPYGFASASELSLFRRPLPSTNLKFNSSVMWDGRETASDSKSKTCLIARGPASCFASLDFDLLHQANSAVRGHAQATADLTAAQQRAIVDFEKSLTTAQLTSNAAGALNAAGVKGGPAALAATAYYFGINDFISGDYQTKAPFTRNVMSMYGAWINAAPPPAPTRPGQPPAPAPSASNLAKASIARGEQLFNTRAFLVDQVPGFSDEVPVAQQRTTCSSCHDAPNVGSQSVTRQFHTGVAAALRRTAELPLYTLKNKTTGETIQVSDPGQAMISGKWKDIGRFKVPGLRALEARAPFFHDGSARDLADVVQFYDRRFRIGLTPQEAADLTAFLRAL